MNKLEPILKYHFWMLLAVGLIMAFTGWWMTTGKMQAAITERQNKIKAAVEKVPKDGANHPNKDWEEKLKVINGEQDKLIRQSSEWLYVRQKERMVWPSWIREEASKLEYRDDFKDSRHHIIYRDNYMKEVLRLYQIPRPITSRDPEGVVIFPESAMPHREWGDDPPTSKQMWDSMEDLWLVEPILQAILEVNGGPKATRYDAAIVAIEDLKLRGGDRSKIGQSNDAALGGGPGAGGPGAGGPIGAGFPGAGLDAKAAMTGTGGLSGSGGSVDFNESEEFGDPGTEGAADAGQGPAAGGPAGPAGPAGAAAGAGFPDGKVGMSGTTGANSEDVGRRYIDDDPAAPYRTRGFKLTVIMDHRKVPDLYAQLTSSERSPWPIEIVRMNIARVADADGPVGEMGRPFGGVGGLGGLGGKAGGFNRPDERPGFGAGGFPAGRPGMGRPGMGVGKPFGGAAGDVNVNANSNSADQMENPFLARVAIAGLITMFRKPPVPEGGTPSAAPTTVDAPVGDLPPSDVAAEGDPAESEDTGTPGAATELDGGEPVGDEEMEESPVMQPEDDAAPDGENQPSEQPEPDGDEPPGEEPATESDDQAADSKK